METKALVLGGGGVTGIAWSLGMLAGWLEDGLDLTDADLVVGTSAGSVVGTQLRTGCDLRQLYTEQLAGPGSEVSPDVHKLRMLLTAPALLRAPRSAHARQRIGAMALRAQTVSETERLQIIADRLPVHDWPAGRLLVTAVDAGTGEFHVFERDDGVSLVDAVAASCAVPGVWPPVTIGNSRWIDGGIRSGTNVDLANGYDRVLLIAPLRFGTAPLLREVRQHAQVVALSPDESAKPRMGKNPLDASHRPAAARAGYDQASRTRETVNELWS